MASVVRSVLAALLVVSSIGAAPVPTTAPDTSVGSAVIPATGGSISALLAEERYEVANAGKRSLMDLSEGTCEATGEANAQGRPAAEALTDLTLEPAPLGACCRICSTGKACGNSCISRALNCRVGVGCACDAAPPAPVAPRATPSPVIQVARQSAFPRLRVGEAAELSLDLNVTNALWLNGDVEMRVVNATEASRGLRGWDAAGTIGTNRGIVVGSSTQQFRAFVQGLAPGTHRLRVGFFHRSSGQVGPDGVYWDVSVDPISGVSRLYEGWHSAWAGQSPYLVMRPAQMADFWIRFANIGTETWERGARGRQVNLALNGDDKSPYRLGMAVNWLWDDRIATTTNARVRPGEVAEFRFTVRAPASTGVYLLNLRPVVEGTAWLEDEGVFWVVEVR